MNAPSLASGSTPANMFKSLGFINIDGIRVFNGRKAEKRIDFTTSPLRGKWSRCGMYTAVIGCNGEPYLRYGIEDVTTGEVFKEAVKQLGCTQEFSRILIEACTPPEGYQFDTEDLLMKICGQKVLS